MLLILLLALGGASVPFDLLPPERRPTREAVERALCVRAGGFGFANTRWGFDSYLTRWHPCVAVDVLWQIDKRGDIRVTRVSFRLRGEKENFLPLRRRP